MPNTKPLPDHLPFLDEIRGVAILAVFLFHALGASYGFYTLPWDGLVRDFHVSRSFFLFYPLTYGGSGVAIFFAVSGFCIHYSHLRAKNPMWCSFASRRFFRIYPPYLLALAVFFFAPPWSTGGGFASPSERWQFFTHLFTVHNLNDSTFFGINPSFWSIGVELQLYAIYPILLWCSRNLGWPGALLITAVIEGAIRIALSLEGTLYEASLPPLVTVSPFAFWFSWACGAWLAECLTTNRPSRLFQIRFDLLLAIAILVPFFRITAPFEFPVFALLTTIAMERLLSGKWRLPTASISGAVRRHLAGLGLVSYSFYLFHQPLLELPRRLFRDGFDLEIHPFLIFLACLATYPLIFLVSSVLYRSVEKPAASLGKRF